MRKNTEKTDDMNILYLSRTMGQGGAEKIVYQLAVDAAQRGAGVFVASCGGVYVDRMEQKGIRHIQVDDLECKKPWVILRTVRILAGIIRNEKIDLIHSHHRMAQFYAFLLKYLFPKIQIVYTAHNIFPDKIIFMKMILHRTAIVSVGKCVKKNLTETFGVEPERIQIIYNRIQFEKPEKKYRNDTLDQLRGKGNWLIGAVGRLSEQKGVDVFIDTVQTLKIQKIPVKGILIGDGEERDRLEKLIDEKALRKDIVLLGYQDHIPTLISQLDLIVMPSRWEGYPLLPLEVFAAHKTLVASNIDGINEIVEDGKNGILVPKDDKAAFSKSVITLLKNDALRNKLEENGRKTLEKYNNYRDFVDQYYQLYEKSVEERQ